MDKDLAIALVQAAAPVALGCIGFFVRSYFKHLERELKALAITMGKFEGHLTAIQTDLRSNSIEVVKVTTQLSALWRWVDAKPRATDNLNGPA